MKERVCVHARACVHTYVQLCTLEYLDLEFLIDKLMDGRLCIRLSSAPTWIRTSWNNQVHVVKCLDVEGLTSKLLHFHQIPTWTRTLWYNQVHVVQYLDLEF